MRCSHHPWRSSKEVSRRPLLLLNGSSSSGRSDIASSSSLVRGDRGRSACAGPFSLPLHLADGLGVASGRIVLDSQSTVLLCRETGLGLDLFGTQRSTEEQAREREQ